MSEILKPFDFPPGLAKIEVSRRLEEILHEQGMEIIETDFGRPWGGFHRIADRCRVLYIETYFGGIPLPEPIPTVLTVSPKITVVEAGQMTSWQVHERRGEFNRVIDGPVGLYLSITDVQPQELQTYQSGECFHIPVGTRHRPVGLEQRAIFAELWIHTDPTHPSDEADIRRIADMYQRV